MQFLWGLRPNQCCGDCRDLSVNRWTVANLPQCPKLRAALGGTDSKVVVLVGVLVGAAIVVACRSP